MSTSNSNIQIGAVFAGRFKILKCLGVGGMGEVYLAEDQLLSNSQIALKFLSSEMSSDPRQVERFLREVLLTRKVSHPNVVKTFDASLLDGQLYFVMEYVDGQSLKELIAHKSIKLSDAIEILKQIAQGLGSIHQAEIIHRDLKPANLMIQSNGQIKIADFGIARTDTSELTNHNEIIGSSHYMSPEAWKGENISYKTDIYSFGIVAFQVLTGELPFDGSTSAQIMFKHLEGNVPEPRDLNPEIPLWLNNLVLDLLATNPDLRPEINQIITTLESGNSPIKRNPPVINTSDKISNPIGYVSSSVNQPEDLSSIWDANQDMVFAKEKKLTNPNFGVKNIESRTLKGKLRAMLFRPSTDNDKSSKYRLQFLITLTLSALIFYFLLPIILNSYGNYFSNTKSIALRAVKILLDSTIASLLIAWPILIIDSIFNPLKEAFRKFTMLSIIGFGILSLLTIIYTWQLYALIPQSKDGSAKLILGILRLSNPKAISTLLESSLLLPFASSFEASILNNLPSLREVSWGFNLRTLPYYASLLVYFLSFTALIRRNFNPLHYPKIKLLLLPCLFIVLYCLEILLYLLLKSNSSESILRSPIGEGLLALQLSNFQGWCLLINWGLIVLTLNFIVPLLKIKKSA